MLKILFIFALANFILDPPRRVGRLVAKLLQTTRVRYFGAQKAEGAE